MRHLALAACLVLTGSVAHAENGRRAKPTKAKHRVKIAPPIEREDDAESDDENEDEDEAPERTARFAGRSERKAARHMRMREEEEEDEAEDEATDKEERVAFAERDLDEEMVDTPKKLRKATAPARKNDWNVAIGPYLWASSVDADVSIGGESVGTGIDFSQLNSHAKYGIELLAEVRYRKFSITGDLMYGVVGIDAEKEVGPLMVSLDGTASSLLIDGTAGYSFYGDDKSLVSIEGRGGIRYQRTAISGALGLGGSTVVKPHSVSGGSDGFAGGRVTVRPFRRFHFTGAADYGLFGASSTTWSASADASARITKHVMFSLGYRTLTIDRSNTAITMHGPRAALQLLF